MNQMRSVARVVLPLRIRNLLWAAYTDIVFRRAMKRLMKDPLSCTIPGNPIVKDMIFGWGNGGWTARSEYLAACISHALNSNGSILECGSGLSTIVMGAVLQKTGQRLFTLEHLSWWAMKVQRYLERYKLDSVVLWTQPLKEYGDFCWYRVPFDAMPDGFSLVICDGPPYDTKGGRYGLISVMRGRLKPGCVILLDDVIREQEHEIAKRWETELGVSSEILGSKNPYLKMKVL